MLPRGLLKEYANVISLLLRLTDVLTVFLAGWVSNAIWLKQLTLPPLYPTALVIAGCTVFIVFPFFRLYESVRGASFWGYFLRLMQATFFVLVLLSGVAFLTKTGNYFSRGWFLLAGGLLFVFLILFRCGVLLFLRIMRSHGWNERRIVLVGAGSSGQKLLALLQQKLWTGFRIYAVFDDQPEAVPTIAGCATVTNIPEDFGVYLAEHPHEIDEIWLALPLHDERRIQLILHQLRHHTVAVRLALDVLQQFQRNVFRPTLTDVGGFPMLNLNLSPMSGINRVLKAVEDRVLATIMFVFSLPIFIIIGLGIKLTSRGPIFFRQKRHGWDGRIIEVWKFRTMYQHQESGNVITQAVLGDPRVTPFGRFLRKSSLDELPQLINVLQGSMSLVGPRPHAIRHNELYKDIVNDYMQRHKVKPGMTGWAQVNGWRGETDTIDKMQKRIEYDLYYIENWSIFFDLKILFLTLFRGFFSKNAY